MGAKLCGCNQNLNLVAEDVNLNRNDISIKKQITLKVEDNFSFKDPIKTNEDIFRTSSFQKNDLTIDDLVKIMRIQNKFMKFKNKISNNKVNQQQDEEELKKLEDNGIKSEKADKEEKEENIENFIKYLKTVEYESPKENEKDVNFAKNNDQVQVLTSNQNNIIRTKSNYFSNSIRSIELERMDDKLKNILQQLRKPYKLKYSNNKSSTNNEKFCIKVWEDGSTLKGNFIENRLYGIAEIITSDEKYFSGEFVKNKVSGYAILTNAYGTKYEGFWENDQMNGVCLEKWKDGTYYQGEYLNGKRHGFGSYRLPDGTLYQGSFISDSFEGWGIMYFTNNNTYMGEWLDDKMHGYGEYHWHNGKVYVGNWDMDRKQGFGMHYWTNPEKAFVGFWEDNKQSGVGCIFTSKLIRYGIWLNGERIKWLHKYEDIFSKSNLKENQSNYCKKFPKTLEQVKNLLKFLR